MVKAQYWVKARNFSGIPTKEDFQLVEEDLPELKDGGWSSITQSIHRLSFWPIFPNCMNITEIMGSHQVIFTVRNVVAARLCFHRCLWFCSRGCGRHPPGQTSPASPSPLRDGYYSGRYASYWNAFFYFLCRCVVWSGFPYGGSLHEVSAWPAGLLDKGPGLRQI